MERPKGFIPYGDRKMCEDCIFMDYYGTGSRSQQETRCSKVDPPFVVGLEDVCDEFEDKKE